MEIDVTDDLIVALTRGELVSLSFLSANQSKRETNPASLGKALLVLQSHPPLFIHPPKFRMIMSQKD